MSSMIFKVGKIMKRSARRVLITGGIAAAAFGIVSAGVLVFAPEHLPDITNSLQALGDKGYKLPEPPHAAPASESEIQALKSFSKVFVNIGKNTRPALVYIQTKVVVQQQNQGRRRFGFGFGFPFDDFFSPFQGGPQGGGGRGNIQQGAGSGFIVDLKNGYVITNNHVIDGANDIQIGTFDDRTFKGRIIGADKATDVAVVKLENFTPGNLKQVAFGDSDQTEVGDWAVALGAPFQLPQTLTVGVISATGRTKVMGNGSQIEDFIQTDAAINPGNSGGPLLNLDGRVIGINTAIFSQTGSYAGIGFAVPSNMAKTVAEMLISEGKVTRGYIGVTMTELGDLSPENLKELRVPKNMHGVLVRDVQPGSPAEKAGIKPYDVIRTLNDSAIHDAAQLRNKVVFIKPNTEVTLGLFRDGKNMDVKLRVGTFSEEAFRSSKGSRDDESRLSSGVASEFGLALTPLTADVRRQLMAKTKTGVVISNVDDGSFADAAGLMRGDIIVEINRRAVRTVKDVENALSQAKDKGREQLILIERDGRNQIYTLRFQ